MTSRFRRPARPEPDPYRSASHGKATAVWCLKVLGPGVDHTHICSVDVYRAMDHEHRCRCGERAA